MKQPSQENSSKILGNALPLSQGKSETSYIFQQISVAIQNFREATCCLSLGHSPLTRTSISTHWVVSLTNCNVNFKACRLRAGWRKKKLVVDLGRRITAVTNEPLETTYLYQRLFVSLQRGNAVAFNNTFPEA